MSDLEQLQLDVNELVSHHEVRTQWIGPDKHNVKTADNPELAKQRAGGFAWPPPDADRRHTALLEQLRQLRDGYVAATSGPGAHSKAGSRLPAGSDVADLVVDITTGSADLYWRLLRALGRQEETATYAPRSLAALSYSTPGAPRLVLCADELDVKHTISNHGMPDRVDVVDTRGPLLGYSTPTADDALRGIATITGDIDDEQLQRTACRRVHSWVLAARLTLSYSAPMVALGMTCPYCRQQNLLTRSDASSDVFCSTDGCVEEGDNQPRWPRSMWHLLLTGTADTG